MCDGLDGRRCEASAVDFFLLINILPICISIYGLLFSSQVGTAPISLSVAFMWVMPLVGLCSSYI
jgi:hypothetical protein